MWRIILPALALTACASTEAPEPEEPALTGDFCIDAADLYTNPYASLPQRELLMEAMRGKGCFG